MNDKHGFVNYVMDATVSLKAALAVAIATAGSGWALLFNVLEGAVGLVAGVLGVVLTYWLIRHRRTMVERDAFELKLLREQEARRLAEIGDRERHHAPLRRECDKD